MPFHILAYAVTNGINDAGVDMPALVDPTFTRQVGVSGNLHFVSFAPFNLLALYHLQPSALNLRANIPTWNAWGNHSLDAVQAAAAAITIPSPTWIGDYRDAPISLPMQEQWAWSESNTDAAGGHLAVTFMWVADGSWRLGAAQGGQRLTLPFTCTIAGVAGNWSVDAVITPLQQMRAGVYAVNGAQLIGANMLAFRLNFPSAPQVYQGKKLFPGSLALNAAPNIPLQKGIGWLGQWGRFQQVELPQIAGIANANGNVNCVLNLDLTFLGDSPSLLLAA